MTRDRIFHYQKEGKIICGAGVKYALYEEFNPLYKDKCKKCLNELTSIKGVDEVGFKYIFW